MNTTLLNRLNTGKSVHKIFTDFSPIVNQIPAFKGLVDMFTMKISTAEQLLRVIEKDLKAHTAEKNRIADATFNMGAKLGSHLSILAKQTNNEVLLASAVRSVSGLKEGKSNEVLARVQNLRDALVANAKALEAFEVAEADIAAFVAQVTEFEQKTQAPRLFRDDRSVNNQAFAACISEMSDLLRDDLTYMVNGLKDKYPELHAAFSQGSKIVHVVTSARKRSIPAAPKTAVNPPKTVVMSEIGPSTPTNQVEKPNGVLTGSTMG